MASSSRPRVLITGATGLIGQSAVGQLQDADVAIHAVARHTLNRPHLTSHRADLLDPSAVASLVAETRPTHLLHLAWDLSSYDAPHHLAWVRASLHLLEQFHAHGGQRAVLAGTCFEYDFAAGYCTEGHTPTRPTTFYGQAKNSLATLAHAYAQATGLSVATGRIFFVYGPRQPSKQLIPHVIEALLRGRAAECTHGRQIRDYLHVDDVASACVALLQSDVEGAVNIGSGRPTRLRDMIHVIADALGARDLVHLGARAPQPNEPPLLVANPTRLREEVGWTPRFTVRTGLLDTLDWWQSQHSIPTA
jgi:nucleoside-diphosphate-sugar epimerase